MSSGVNWVPGMTVEEAEKQCILQALRFYRGNKSQTAQALRISIRTLDNKLESYETESKTLEARIESDRIEQQRILNRMRGIDVEPTQRIAEQYAAYDRQRNGSAPSNTGNDTQGNDSPNTEQPAAGVHVEPANDVTEKPALPVSKRGKVQKMLPSKASRNGDRTRRKTV